MAACDGTSAAKRRRERRLRSMLRHERQTVAMAIAEFTHHSAPRGQKTARAGEGGGREKNYMAKPRIMPPPPSPPPPRRLARSTSR